MPSHKSAKAAAPIGASDPRHVDQLGRQIGAEANPSKPPPQAIGLGRITVRTERMCCLRDEVVRELLAEMVWNDARRMSGCHDVADLEVEGHV